MVYFLMPLANIDYYIVDVFLSDEQYTKFNNWFVNSKSHPSLFEIGKNSTLNIEVSYRPNVFCTSVSRMSIYFLTPLTKKISIIISQTFFFLSNEPFIRNSTYANSRYDILIWHNSNNWILSIKLSFGGILYLVSTVFYSLLYEHMSLKWWFISSRHSRMSIIPWTYFWQMSSIWEISDLTFWFNMTLIIQDYTSNFRLTES